MSVTEKASEEDGTKTFKAIKESIVSVTPPESAVAVTPVVEETAVVVEEAPLKPKEVSIYGVSLLQDDRSDVILLKFLRARDFKVPKGTPFTYRFRVPKEGSLKINDFICGECLEGMLEVMKSNGQPVYNFCVTVDDATMAISHVIRAEEHLPNTLRQALIYKTSKKEKVLYRFKSQPRSDV